ncbi:MAG: hypothetical protein U0575_00220 [Phycisphaerales bacterium]
MFGRLVATVHREQVLGEVEADSGVSGSSLADEPTPDGPVDRCVLIAISPSRCASMFAGSSSSARGGTSLRFREVGGEAHEQIAEIEHRVHIADRRVRSRQ